jgi:hypothetical protein
MKYLLAFSILIILLCSCYKENGFKNYRNQFYCEYKEDGVSVLIEGHEYEANDFKFVSNIGRTYNVNQLDTFYFRFNSYILDLNEVPLFLYPGKFSIELTKKLTPFYLNEDYNLISSNYLRKFFVEDSVYDFAKINDDEGINISVRVDTTIYNTIEYYGNQIKPNYNDLNNYYRIIYVEDFYSQLYEKKVIRVTAEFSATVFNYQGDSIRIDNGKICSLYTY